MAKSLSSRVEQDDVINDIAQANACISLVQLMSGEYNKAMKTVKKMFEESISKILVTRMKNSRKQTNALILNEE